MLGETQNIKDGVKNVKDSSSSTSLAIKDSFSTLSYTKTNKLIAGLYMVTDIMDREEPMRPKLRTLGLSILSDINSSSFSQVDKSIGEIMSFIDIASIVGNMSSMNSSILKKEFNQLQESVKEAMSGRGMPSLYGGEVTLSDFLTDTEEEEKKISPKSNFRSIGHVKSMRIGVQKGHTLMQALSDRIPALSNKKDFDVFKRERREEIKRIVVNQPEGATITDIKTKAQGHLASCSEKTLQRELFSMVKDDVLFKKGEKRWSRYFLNLM